jgi:hypothetical protein
MANECATGIYLSPEELTAASLEISTEASERIAGIDFLHIADTNTHAGIDCYMIYVNEAAVFNEIIVGGVNIVTTKGMSGKTINPGVPLPFGKVHATSIDLTSGSVTAYIY